MKTLPAEKTVFVVSTALAISCAVLVSALQSPGAGVCTDTITHMASEGAVACEPKQYLVFLQNIKGETFLECKCQRSVEKPIDWNDVVVQPVTPLLVNPYAGDGGEPIDPQML